VPFLFSSNLEPGSQPSARYPVPFRGVNKVLPVHMLPPDAIFDGQNCAIRHGELRSRAGLLRQSDQVLRGIPMAALNYIGKDGMKRPIILTTEALYQYTADAWEPIGDMPAASRDDPGSLTTLEADDRVYLIISNGVSPLHWWYPEGPLEQIPQHGTAETPTFRAIATANNRIIGVQFPYTVKWSQFLAPDEWRESNVAILADTEDEIVTVCALGTLGFSVYKAGSIWVGFIQAGTDANAFKFEHFGQYEGPANPQALVYVSGVDIYMTPSGRIGSFDGSQQVWLCDGIWPFVANDLDPMRMRRIRLSYTYLHNEVTVYYPILSSGGSVHNLITINLPYPEQGVQTIAAFNGVTHLDIAACLNIRLFAGDRNPWLFTADGLVFKSSGQAYDDDMVPFSCALQPGLHAIQTFSVIKPFFELYALRDQERGFIDVYEVHSGLLAEIGGAVELKGLTLDLTRKAPNQFFGMTVADTYIGFRVEWQSDARFHYYGANFYSRVQVP
jgi:hypothetical protein